MDDGNRHGASSHRDVDVDVNMDGGGATALNAAPDAAASAAVDTTGASVGVAGGSASLPADTGAALIQSLRERRLITLALADQVGEDRWRAVTLPHDHSLHDVLVGLLAWDEWAAAVFELSLLRGLPPKLIAPTQSAGARHEFEARAKARYTPLGRADLLASLQAAGERAVSGAIGRGVEGWATRPIAGLVIVQMPGHAPYVAAGAPGGATNAPGGALGAGGGDVGQHAPTVGDILRWLMSREEQRDAEISVGLHVSADIEQLRARFTREPASAQHRGG